MNLLSISILILKDRYNDNIMRMIINFNEIDYYHDKFIFVIYQIYIKFFFKYL